MPSVVEALKRALVSVLLEVARVYRALGQTLSDFFPGTPKSMTSSSAVAVSMVVATFLLGNPLSSSSASAVRWGVPKVNLKFEPEPV